MLSLYGENPLSRAFLMHLLVIAREWMNKRNYIADNVDTLKKYVGPLPGYDPIVKFTEAHNAATIQLWIMLSGNPYGTIARDTISKRINDDHCYTEKWCIAAKEWLDEQRKTWGVERCIWFSNDEYDSLGELIMNLPNVVETMNRKAQEDA